MDGIRFDSYCGLYCRACEIMSAYIWKEETGEETTWDDLPEPFRSEIACAPIICNGCKSENVFAGCAACADYPCFLTRKREKLIESMSQRLPHLRSVSLGEHHPGSNEWMREQRVAWSCPTCGEPFSWYQRFCRKCGSDLKGTQEL